MAKTAARLGSKNSRLCHIAAGPSNINPATHKLADAPDHGKGLQRTNVLWLI